MIILELPTGEQINLTDKNERAVCDIFKDLPDDMEIICRDSRGRELDRLTVKDLF